MAGHGNTTARRGGRLDGVVDVISDPDFFVAMYVRREAVLSSQIEGTQSTLEDLLEVELFRRPLMNVNAAAAAIEVTFPTANRLVARFDDPSPVAVGAARTEVTER